MSLSGGPTSVKFLLLLRLKIATHVTGLHCCCRMCSKSWQDKKQKFQLGNVLIRSCCIESLFVVKIKKTQESTHPQRKPIDERSSILIHSKSPAMSDPASQRSATQHPFPTTQHHFSRPLQRILAGPRHGAQGESTRTILLLPLPPRFRWREREREKSFLQSNR